MQNKEQGVAFDFAERQRSHVDGLKLAEDLIGYFRQYVRVGEDEYTVLATWVLHCHTFEAFTRTPYLSVTSPAPGCGKTQLLEVAELVVPDPIMTSCCTNAVLARTIDQDHPVLMIDEFDQLQAGDKELLASIIATVNSGYKKSGNRLILERQGGVWQRKRLSTYCPKILSGISSLPAITKSRCIPIHMERLAPGDSVSDPDEYTIEPQAARLKALAEAWGTEHLQELARAKPDSPPKLRNRQREVSRPLFAVADALGGSWPDQVRSAMVRLFTAMNNAPTDDIKIELLGDIRQVFGDRHRMASTDLVQVLVEIEDKPWAMWNKAKALNPNQLSRLLKDFKVYPKNIRLDTGRVVKGYERLAFELPWARYLPHTGTEPATVLQPSKTPDETQSSPRYTPSLVASEKYDRTAPIQHRSVVAAENGNQGHRQGKIGGNGHARGLPSCPACGSFALYRKSDDIFECLTCEDSTAARVMQ